MRFDLPDGQRTYDRGTVAEIRGLLRGSLMLGKMCRGRLTHLVRDILKDMDWATVARVLFFTNKELSNLLETETTLHRKIFKENTKFVDMMFLYTPWIKAYSTHLTPYAWWQDLHHSVKISLKQVSQPGITGAELLRQKIHMVGDWMSQPGLIVRLPMRDSIDGQAFFSPVHPLVCITVTEQEFAVYTAYGENAGKICHSESFINCDNGQCRSHQNKGGCSCVVVCPGRYIRAVQWSPSGSYLMVQTSSFRRYRDWYGFGQPPRGNDTIRLHIYKVEGTGGDLKLRQLFDERRYRCSGLLTSPNLWVTDRLFLVPGHNKTTTLLLVALEPDRCNAGPLCPDAHRPKPGLTSELTTQSWSTERADQPIQFVGHYFSVRPRERGRISFGLVTSCPVGHGHDRISLMELSILPPEKESPAGNWHDAYFHVPGKVTEVTTIEDHIYIAYIYPGQLQTIPSNLTGVCLASLASREDGDLFCPFAPGNRVFLEEANYATYHVGLFRVSKLNLKVETIILTQ
jgi:hypothetical protein